jgi:hypothetical protein
MAVQRRLETHLLGELPGVCVGVSERIENRSAPEDILRSGRQRQGVPEIADREIRIGERIQPASAAVTDAKAEVQLRIFRLQAYRLFEQAHGLFAAEAGALRCRSFHQGIEHMV